MGNVDNKVKHVYKCGVCGAVYDSIEDRAACERECLKKQEEEKKKAEEAMRIANREKRTSELHDALKHLKELVRDFNNDYGTNYAISVELIPNHYDSKIDRMMDLLTNLGF